MTDIGIRKMDSAINRLFGVSGPLLMVMSGFALISFGSIYAKSEFQTNITHISGVALVLFGGAVSALKYLKGDKKQYGYSGDNIVNISHSLEEEDISKIQSSIEEKIEIMIESISKKSDSHITLSESERKELLESAKANLSKEFSESLFETAKKEVELNNINERNINLLKKELGAAKARLINEISALARRGNLNLVIGSFTTILAVGLLAYIVLTAELKSIDINNFLWFYIPRATIAIFIEIFSFFFLRLYRNSLEDIKYFQNELTNVDLRFAALESSLYIGKTEILKEVVVNMSSTDRNFILKKGESTVGLEKLKAENKSLNDLLMSAKDILGSLGSKKA